MLMAERFEDMSPRGRLRLFIEDDGDVIVEVVSDPESQSAFPGASVSVQFCTPGMGGGHSSRTLAALRALLDAMTLDNVHNPHRRGERGLGSEKEAPRG